MPDVAVVVASVHHGNTRAIAEALARPLAAELLSVEEAVSTDLGQYELVGFGSGIYFGRHHPSLLRLAESAPRLPPTAFLFSTAGVSTLSRVWHQSLRRRLLRRGCRIAGEFSCPGWDSVGPLRLIGGIHRGRPSARDFEAAEAFSRSLWSGRRGQAAGRSSTPASPGS